MSTVNPLAKFLDRKTPESTKQNDQELELIVLSCAKEDCAELKEDKLIGYLEVKKAAEEGMKTTFKGLGLLNVESMNEISGAFANVTELFRLIKDRAIDVLNNYEDAPDA